MKNNLDMLKEMLARYTDLRDHADEAAEEAYKAVRVAGQRLDEVSDEEYDEALDVYDECYDAYSGLHEDYEDYERLVCALEEVISALEVIGE